MPSYARSSSERVSQWAGAPRHPPRSGADCSDRYYGYVPYDEALASRVRAALATQPGVEEKKMFGGLSFMVGGKMCCGVLKDQLVVRVGSERYDEALAQPHTRPFDFTGRPSTGMVYVAGEGLGDHRVLEKWLRRALDVAASTPHSEKQSRTRR
jgi:TfoX/Sxy family transcriptional regulator of competence genes